jgi:hypothetical protein
MPIPRIDRLAPRLTRAAVLLAAPLALLAAAGSAFSQTPSPTIAPTTASSCALSNPTGAGNGAGRQGDHDIQHVIYVQFDNVHFTRDNPNVPSDLEQMPNLLNFIKSNGILDNNHHTPLISHTADDILTSLTGVYGDQHGQPVANSYGYFSGGVPKFQSSFTYWTDPAADGTPNLMNAAGANAPAPWVPFTRAGCNVGAVSIADMEIENLNGDLVKLYGSIPADASAANYEGIAIHCAQMDPFCSTTNGGVADPLPQEPGGYNNYSGLFGHKYAVPAINGGSASLKDLDGNTIEDCSAHVGFPGFGGISAAQTLGYAAQMEEHNVPVVFAYIADAHDNHSCTSGGAPTFGPGEAGYVAQLKAYDKAWGEFFARLKADGIGPQNTLFVITADENDHFVGGKPSNSGCDGVTTPCSYDHVNGCTPLATKCPADNVGELDGNLAGLLKNQGVTTPFAVHSDDAPTVYISGNPAQTDQMITRPFERAVSKLAVTNPLTGGTDTLSVDLADQAEESLLHMVTGDPARTPTFTMFGDPDYFLSTFSPACSNPPNAAGPCTDEENGFAWNHGDVQKDIVVTWLGLVGPGVRGDGVRNDTWTDHTDIRPTILVLTGLADDYPHEGSAILPFLTEQAIPSSLRAHDSTMGDLITAFKSINAPVNQLGLDSLVLSTAGVTSGTSTSDTLYTQIDSVISCITTQRNAIAGQMLSAIEGAEFNNQSLDEGTAKNLTNQAQALLQLVHSDAANPQSATCTTNGATASPPTGGNGNQGSSSPSVINPPQGPSGPGSTPDEGHDSRG